MPITPIRIEGSEEWLTPPHIVRALGPFDIDPASPIVRPWDTARIHYSKLDNGLQQKWCGRVWLNPPYGNKTSLWLEKMAEHNNGIALVFARLETAMFFRYVWGHADAVMALKGRLSFHRGDGTLGCHTSGCPSVLIAYGKENTQALLNSGLEGALLTELRPQ